LRSTFLQEEGVKHEFSAPYTPQQNGVVERKNRTLIDMARMMLGEFKTPERFWSEAVNTACHAINRLYLHRLLKKTCYELLTGNCWGPSSSEGPQKHNLTMSSKYGLWIGIFGFMIKAYTMRSMIVTKVAVAPKLCARELRLNRRKGNRLKREKAIQSS
jgi:hypothetical protein